MTLWEMASHYFLYPIWQPINFFLDIPTWHVIPYLTNINNIYIYLLFVYIYIYYVWRYWNIQGWQILHIRYQSALGHNEFYLFPLYLRWIGKRELYYLEKPIVPTLTSYGISVYLKLPGPISKSKSLRLVLCHRSVLSRCI